jgi:hypothetical protein
MAEFTILDAPETPAPVFAFRALKGVIFGSPNDDDERNKENATSPKQVPTLRSKISALRAPAVSPSKRRKTNQYASPAKSILRTPGIPTPRRQNANVTFKDVTPSLSPELMRKGPAPKERPREEEVEAAVVGTLPNAKKDLSAPEISAAVPKACNQTKDVQKIQVPEQTPAVFDVEAYKLSTEKEMKKLVRHGQKMREYARKQDEENTKLRIALEKLQRENEELRKREGLREASRQEKQEHGQVMKKARREVPGTRSGINTTLDFEDKKFSKPIADGARLRSTSMARHSVVISKASPPKNGRSSPLKRKATAQLRPEPLPVDNSKVPVGPDLQSTNQSRAEDDAPVSRPGTARLPLDRVAAARERIRLKAELRRKTTASTSSPVNWNAL